MPKSYDPALINMKLVAVGFERRYGDAPTTLIRRLFAVELFVDGAAPEVIAETLEQDIGFVKRTLGFALNLSTRSDRAGRYVQRVAAFRGLSIRIQNAFAAEGLTTKAQVRAQFDSNFNPLRKFKNLGASSIFKIVRWLGHEHVPRGVQNPGLLDSRIKRAVIMLERHGYEVVKKHDALSHGGRAGAAAHSGHGEQLPT